MFSKRRRKFNTINEIHNMISNLEQKSKRMPEIIGFRSSDICKNFKELMTLCNSLCIVFIQYDLIQDCQLLLKASSEADANLCKHGTVLDRLWQGRILTYNNLAFLYYRVDQHSDSLKFLYEAHGLAQSIKESGGIANSDLSLATNILTFVALWKLKRYQQSSGYLELAGEVLNDLSSGKKLNKLSDTNIQNLFGIISICMAGLAVKTENSFKKGIAILEHSLTQITSNDIHVKNLIKDQLRDLYKKKNTSSSVLNSSNSEISVDNNRNEDFLPKIPSEVLNSQFKPNYDWLITKEFENIFFITCFVPFISPNTPLVRTSELENLKTKNKTHDYIESSYPIKELPQEVEDIELPKIKPYRKFKKTVQSKQSSNRKQSLAEKNSSKGPSWWEKRTESRYPSEPRGSSYSNRQVLPRINTPYKPEGFNNITNNLKKPKEVRNNHIMLEFNPMHGENIPFELVPLPPSRSKPNTQAFNNVFDSYLIDICE
jgi:hypothetical protein